MSENNFIKSVEFKKGKENLFPPFKGGDKIYFGGEEEVKKLIEFYLKSKPENKNKSKEEIKKNAERFKINCVLGNNGGGKSRLFEGILYDEVDINDGELNYFNILDSFFKLSGNIEQSVNYNIILDVNINSFYCEVLDFLNNYDKSIFNSFLNLDKDYSYLLEYKFNKDWYKNFKGEYIYFSEIENKENIKDFINSELNFEDVYTFFENLYNFLNGEQSIFENDFLEKVWFNVADLFIYLVNESRNRLMQFTTVSENSFFIKQRGYKKFKKSLIFFKYFLDLIKKYKLQDIYFKNSFSLENNDVGSLYLKKGEYFNREDFNILIENTQRIIEILNLLEKLKEKKAEEKVKEYFGINLNYFLKKCSGYEQTYIDSSNFFVLEILTSFKLKQKEIDEYFGLKFQLFIYYGIRNIFREKEIIKKEKCFTNKITKKEKSFLSFFIFNLDLFFYDSKIRKTFNNLSAGEKTILTRFTNIYRTFYNSVIPRKLEKGNTAIILIDEPDLHLHLDWQKKYIQKLIDVFSTLNTNIKLHFIIATHSPFIISDLPTESIIVLDGSEENKYGGKFTEILTYDKQKEHIDFNNLEEFKNYYKNNYKGNRTFGANFVDLINDGFFFENKVLMGSFAKENIKLFSIAQKFLMLGLDKIREENLNEKEKRIYNFLKENNIEKIEDFKKYIDNIGDEFLKQNLLYL